MLTPRRLRTTPNSAQRGLSLVELMVGIAIGLILVAAASMLMSMQLGENRRLVVETQLQQDMRAAMDVIGRELRRIGAQSESLALQGLWVEGGGPAQKNVYAESPTATVSGTAVDNLNYGYWQPGVSTAAFGFKLDDGGIKMRIGGVWQELTDRTVMEVTTFTITPQNSSSIRLPCPKPCPDTTTNCWPEVQVREFAVNMTGRARNVPGIDRSLRSNVRVRNDYVHFKTGTADLCPA